MNRTYFRGDMYFADLGKGIDSEQEGYRPVVIIQNNIGNKYSPTVIVASISGKISTKLKLPTYYYIGAENGLGQPSIILLEQIRTIDKHRLENYIAKNPFLDATLPEHKECKQSALTPEQLHRILKFTDRPKYYDYYVMHCAIQLAFACRLRGGEVGGAQWERFDAKNNALFVDRVIDRVDKKLANKLTKMDILFMFPNLYPGIRTAIFLKQPKTEGSIRTVYIPDTVIKKLEKLRELQNKLKIELGDDGYMDYGLVICQANGRPIMTEHLNKRFKESLRELDDPTIDIDNIVFYSLRHTSAGVKLRLSKGDLKAVQGDGGWNTPDMITKRYAHIMDEDRRTLAEEMDPSFYGNKKEAEPQADTSPELTAMMELLKSNPELLK